MRTPTKGPDKPVTYLWERHKEIANLVVAGHRPIDICKELGYTPTWMSIIMNSPVFKKYVASLRVRVEEGLIDVKKKLYEGSTIGVVKLLEILNDKDTQKSLQVKVAQDFLDRAGFPKVSKVEQNNVNIVLDTEMIERLKENRTAKLANLKVINI